MVNNQPKTRHQICNQIVTCQVIHHLQDLMQNKASKLEIQIVFNSSKCKARTKLWWTQVDNKLQMLMDKIKIHQEKLQNRKVIQLTQWNNINRSITNNKYSCISSSSSSSYNNSNRYHFSNQDRFLDQEMSLSVILTTRIHLSTQLKLSYKEIINIWIIQVWQWMAIIWRA
jgi:hypothetical protein